MLQLLTMLGWVGRGVGMPFPVGLVLVALGRSEVVVGVTAGASTQYARPVWKLPQSLVIEGFYIKGC